MPIKNAIIGKTEKSQGSSKSRSSIQPKQINKKRTMGVKLNSHVALRRQTNLCKIIDKSLPPLPISGLRGCMVLSDNAEK